MLRQDEKKQAEDVERERYSPLPSEVMCDYNERMGMCSWEGVIQLREEDLWTRSCKTTPGNRRAQYARNARNTQAVLGISEEQMEELSPPGSDSGPSPGIQRVIAASLRHSRFFLPNPNFWHIYESSLRAAILKGCNEEPDPACPSTIFQHELDFGEGEVSRLFMIHSSVVFDLKSCQVIQHTTAMPIDALQSEREQRQKAETASKEAKAAEAAATGVLAMISHELRNTTQGIHTTASSMLDERVTEPQLRNLASTCNAQLAHLQRVLNDAFELGEMVSQPRAAVPHTPVSIHLVVSDAVWGMMDFALSSGVRLATTPQVSAAAAIFVDSHHAAISSALNNLISNSVRYTPRGGSISIGLEVDAECVTVLVHDTGYGIPEAVTTALLEANMGGSAQGAGIGLYVANQTLKRLANGVLILRSSSAVTGTVWCIALSRSSAAAEERQQNLNLQWKRQRPSFTLAAGMNGDVLPASHGGAIPVDVPANYDDVVNVAAEGAMQPRFGASADSSI
jgi:signal transduction histidine kinase